MVQKMPLANRKAAEKVMAIFEKSLLVFTRIYAKRVSIPKKIAMSINEIIGPTMKNTCLPTVKTPGLSSSLMNRISNVPGFNIRPSI